MRSHICTLLLFACLIQVLSCKKDTQTAGKTSPQVQSLETGLLTFSINGQLLAANIDTTLNSITVVVPRTMDEHSLTANFTLAAQVNAKINNAVANNGTVVDFTKPVTITVTSADQKRSTSFQVNVETDLQYMGIRGTVLGQKSLNKDYTFYFDQFDGSQFEFINCGPTSSSMAIKWADSTFTGTPVYARTQFEPQGGWWATTDVTEYMNRNNINNITDTLGNVADVVKRSIDNNNVLVLCLDMYQVPQNDLGYEHVQKFYQTNAAGWGHFIMIKGYIQTDANFYLEAYDPYSEGDKYSILTSGQLKGKDRYYLDYDIKAATSIWWPYAIIVAPKGQQVVASTRLSTNSIHKTIPQAFGR